MRTESMSHILDLNQVIEFVAYDHFGIHPHTQQAGFSDTKPVFNYFSSSASVADLGIMAPYKFCIIIIIIIIIIINTNANVSINTS